MARLAPLAALLACAACASRPWDGRVETWGSMREIMNGKTGGRVDLSAVLTGHAIAIGSLEGLCGEFAILDGEVWSCRFESGELWCSRGLIDCPQATMLVSADVPRWRTLTLHQDAASLDELLARVADEHGLSRFHSWPFAIDGEFDGLESHVLRGACPLQEDVDPALAPFRRSFEHVSGSLIGFFAPHSEGEITHHGERSHVHFVPYGDTFVAHVDSVRVRAGARLRIPETR